MSFASWGEIMIQFDFLSYTSYILFRKYVKDTAADATAALDVDKIAALTRLLRLEVTAFACRSAGRLCQNEIDRQLQID